MKFTTKKPPIVQNSESTYKRSLNLHLALIVASIATVVIKIFTTVAEGGDITSQDNAFKAFMMLVVAAFISVIIELFYSLSEGDTTKFSTYKGFVEPINVGLLIALLLPLSTPIYVLILAVAVGVYAGKIVFGGYGFYIFNPALVGVLFATLSFGGQMPVGQTPLIALKEVFTMGSTFELGSITDLLIGNYSAVAIGSTSVIVLGLLFIYLCITKVIDLRLSGTFLVTVLIMSLGIGWILWAFDENVTMAYVLINMITGLTVFAATFLVSEPISTPTSRETKLVYAVVVAVLMMLFRTLSENPEGIIFAVLFGNMITPFINRTVKRSDNKSLLKTIIGLSILVIVVTVAIGFILQGQLIELQEAALMGGIL